MAGATPDLDALREAMELRRAEARQPDLLRAYVDLGEGYLEAGQADAAESAFRTATAQARIWGDSVELGRCLLHLGRTMVHIGRSDRALLAFTEAAGHFAGRDDASWAEAAKALSALGTVEGGAR